MRRGHVVQQSGTPAREIGYEAGQATVEYGLTLGGVGLVIFAVLMLVGQWLTGVFSQIIAALS